MYFTCVSNSENIIHSTWSNPDNHSVHFQQYIFEYCVVSLKPQWNETNFLISSNKNILSNVERLRLFVSAFSWPAFLSFIIESIYVCIIQQRQRSRDSKVSQIRRRNGTSARAVFPTREGERGEREGGRERKRGREREKIESTLPFSELFHFQREFMTILPGSRRRCSSAGFNCAPFSRRILLPADRPSRLV